MINIILPIVEEEKDYSLIKKAKASFKDSYVIVGTVESLKNKFKGADLLLIFEDGAEVEQMIGKLVKACKEGEIIICRNLKVESLEKLRQKDITMFRKKTNNFFRKVKKFFYQIASSIFGFSLFDGDIGSIYFSEKASVVLRNLNVLDISFASRVNKWAGLEVCYIDKEIKAYQPKVNDKKHFLNLIINSSIFSLSLVMVILLSMFLQIAIPIALLFVFLLVITLFMMIFSVFKVIVIGQVGELRVNALETISVGGSTDGKKAETIKSSRRRKDTRKKHS